MRTLVVTEKFNTALRISVVLSDGDMTRTRQGPVAIFSFKRPEGEFTVMGLRGHIVELDYPEALNVWSLNTLPQLIEAEPLRRVTEQAIVSTLQGLAPKFDRVILATDWDREGEVIAAECLEILHEVNPRLAVKRAHYSALTRPEVEASFANLKELDTNLADAGKARQNIDLMWGAMLTRYLTLTSRREGGGRESSGFLSVGRVQTPTLALLVERDRAIRTFVPEPFWDIFADAVKEGIGFRVKHTHGRWMVRAEVDAVMAKVDKATRATVSNFKEEETRVHPPVPFNTTLFVSEATKLGFGAAQVMRIAEDLYVQGLISYPRTDNTVYPRSLKAQNVLEMLQKGAFAKDAAYCLAQESIRVMRGRTETTDHPPIYPTGNADPKKLRGDKAQIYELVVRRYLATVAPDARGNTRTAELSIKGEPFEGQGFRLTDPGWYRVYPYAQSRESDLPVLVTGESIEVTRVEIVEDKTRPPYRYTQGSLLQEMERLGLGTKSTRHDVIQKLFDRHYANAKGLEPTASGIAVTEALQANADFVTKPEMTSRLETDMDAIAQGQKTLKDIVGESREMLREVYDVLQKNSEAVRDTLQGALDKQHYVGPCPKCGGALRMARSPRGTRWVQCANNPRSCTANYPLPSAGFIEPCTEICATCKVPKVRIIYRGQRPQNYCINPLCEEHLKEYRIGSCPSCGSPLHIRYSFKGNRFVGCTGYPTCRVTYPLPQRGGLDKSHAPCEVCRAPIVTAIERGRPPWTLCINPECPTRKKPAEPSPKTAPGAETTAKPGAKKAATRKPRVAKPKAEVATGETSPSPPAKKVVRRPRAAKAPPAA